MFLQSGATNLIEAVLLIKIIDVLTPIGGKTTPLFSYIDWKLEKNVWKMNEDV